MSAPKMLTSRTASSTAWHEEKKDAEGLTFSGSPFLANMRALDFLFCMVRLDLLFQLVGEEATPRTHSSAHTRSYRIEARNKGNLLRK